MFKCTFVCRKALNCELLFAWAPASISQSIFYFVCSHRGDIRHHPPPTLRKVWVPIWLWKQPSAQERTLTWDVSTPDKKKEEFRLDSDDFGLIWSGKATWSVIKQTSDIISVVCNKLTTVWAPTKNCSLADSFLDLNTAVVEWRMS